LFVEAKTKRHSNGRSRISSAPVPRAPESGLLMPSAQNQQPRWTFGQS
jgi:hypothetical protein